MLNKKQLLNFTIDEMKELAAAYGEKPYRGSQLFDSLYQGKVLNEISNLPLAFRQRLSQDFDTDPIHIESVFSSKVDETKKFIYYLSDHNCIEGVLMRYKYGNTLCVSTQVGCRMGCRFCASTLDGKARDLTAGEILGQVICANSFLRTEKVHNIVLMGSGEPFDNYDNVIRFLHLVNQPSGLNLGMRHISLSTCGLVPQINRFASEGLPVTLSLSLHAATDEKRKLIMPIAYKYSVKETIDACMNYFKNTGRRIIIEYALIDNINCDPQSAYDLINLIKGKPFHVNLISLNSVKERKLFAPSSQTVKVFFDILSEHGVSVTKRRSLGQDIEGACGQLRKKYLEKQNENHSSI